MNRFSHFFTKKCGSILILCRCNSHKFLSPPAQPFPYLSKPHNPPPRWPCGWICRRRNLQMPGVLLIAGQILHGGKFAHQHCVVAALRGADVDPHFHGTHLRASFPSASRRSRKRIIFSSSPSLNFHITICRIIFSLLSGAPPAHLQFYKFPCIQWDCR